MMSEHVNGKKHLKAMKDVLKKEEERQKEEEEDEEDEEKENGLMYDVEIIMSVDWIGKFVGKQKSKLIKFEEKFSSKGWLKNFKNELISINQYYFLK